MLTKGRQPNVAFEVGRLLETLNNSGCNHELCSAWQNFKNKILAIEWTSPTETEILQTSPTPSSGEFRSSGILKCEESDGHCIKHNTVANLRLVREQYWDNTNARGGVRIKYKKVWRWICSMSNFWMMPSGDGDISTQGKTKTKRKLKLKWEGVLISNQV